MAQGPNAACFESEIVVRGQHRNPRIARIGTSRLTHQLYEQAMEAVIATPATVRRRVNFKKSCVSFANQLEELVTPVRRMSLAQHNLHIRAAICSLETRWITLASRHAHTLEKLGEVVVTVKQFPLSRFLKEIFLQGESKMFGSTSAEEENRVGF